jgi:uncharacterized membrane protein
MWCVGLKEAAMLMVLDSFCGVLLILSWWLALAVYARLPDTIPVHFDLSGEPDAWGGKLMVFLLPAVQAILLAIQFVVFYVVAGRESKPMPEAMKLPLHLLMLELQALFTWLTWRTTETAFGRAQSLGVWFLPVTLLVILATVGWMLVAGNGLR